MTQVTTVLDSGGSGYVVTNAVLNSAGASFDVHDDVLSADGTAYAVFSLFVPPVAAPTTTPSSRTCSPSSESRSCIAMDN